MDPDVGNEVSLSQTGKSKHFCWLSVCISPVVVLSVSVSEQNKA